MQLSQQMFCLNNKVNLHKDSKFLKILEILNREFAQLYDKQNKLPCSYYKRSLHTSGLVINSFVYCMLHKDVYEK